MITSFASRVDKPSIACARDGQKRARQNKSILFGGLASVGVQMDIQRKISEAQEMLDPVQLGPCRQTYRECPTGRHLFGSHNLYPAGMFRDRCSRPARAPHVTATSRPKCARHSSRIQTARRSLSPTAALRPTSRKSCRSSAAGMSRSSSSARPAAVHSPRLCRPPDGE